MANINTLQKGLIAHYPLNGEYETKDITPNANHGTNKGATLSTGRKGEANGSYSFDGVDDYIELGDSLRLIKATEPFTISAWIKWGGYTGSTNKYQRIVELATDTYDNSFSLVIGNESTYTGIYFGGSGIINGQKVGFYPKLNEWRLITLTYNGSGMTIPSNYKMYYEGIYTPVISETGSYSSSILLNRIGRRGTTDSYFNGSISDVRIYNRALEEDEIKLLYDSFKPEIATSDLNKGLVGHWMLDSENGAKDLTPNGNHGTANGGVTVGGTTDRKGKTGGATEFDGVNDYVDCGNVEGSAGEITISAWIKYTDVGPSGILGKFHTTSYSYGLFMNTFSSGPHFVIKTLSGAKFTETALGYNDGNWHLITGVYNKSLSSQRLKLYIDGFLKSSVDGYNEDILFDAGSVVIGKDTAGRFQEGNISDVRIYNRALSPDEIKLLYDQYKPKEASIGSLNKGLVLDMPLTTKHMKSSTVVADRTPYSNDGTVVGATVGSQYTSFDGVDDWIEVSDNDKLKLENSNLAISMWILNSGGGSGDYSRIIDKKMDYTGASNGYYVCMRDNNYITIALGGSSFQDTVLLNRNRWYHLVVIANGSHWKVYVDGLEQWSVVNSAKPSLSTAPLRIGDSSAEGYLGTRNFQGQISDVKIYNRALSADEVKLLYEKGRN